MYIFSRDTSGFVSAQGIAGNAASRDVKLARKSSQIRQFRITLDSSNYLQEHGFHCASVVCWPIIVIAVAIVGTCQGQGNNNYNQYLVSNVPTPLLYSNDWPSWLWSFLEPLLHVPILLKSFYPWIFVEGPFPNFIVGEISGVTFLHLAWRSMNSTMFRYHHHEHPRQTF